MAFLTALTVTPPVRVLARRLGVTDDPAKARKVHQNVIPRMGGLAIAAGFFLPLMVLWGLETEVAKQFAANKMQVVILAFGGFMILALGVYDDRRGARASVKLAVQVPVAVLLVLAGFTFSKIALPWGGHWQVGYLGPVIAIFWIVGITNAMNLIDGLDGLAAGISLIVVLTLMVVALMSQDYVAAMLNAALGGALIGFLVHNFHPATIFMGDTGSLFIGYCVAAIGILTSTKSTTTVAFLVPVIALSVPILDTTLATFRRLLRGRSPFSADQEHMHHKLLRMGFSHRRAVLVLWAFAFVTCLASLAIVFMQGSQIWSVLTIYAVVATVVIKKLGFIRAENWSSEFKEGRQRKVFAQRKDAYLREMKETFALLEHPDQIPGLLLRLHQISSYGAMRVQITDPFLRRMCSNGGEYRWPTVPEAPIGGGRLVSFSLDGRYGGIGEVTYEFLNERALSVDEETLLEKTHQLIIESLEKIQRANSNIGVAQEDDNLHILPSA